MGKHKRVLERESYIDKKNIRQDSSMEPSQTEYLDMEHNLCMMFNLSLHKPLTSSKVKIKQ